MKYDSQIESYVNQYYRKKIKDCDENGWQLSNDPKIESVIRNLSIEGIHIMLKEVTFTLVLKEKHDVIYKEEVTLSNSFYVDEENPLLNRPIFTGISFNNTRLKKRLQTFNIYDNYNEIESWIDEIDLLHQILAYKYK